MAATKVKTRWVNGNLVFYDTSGNEILTIDGVSRKLSLPAGSTLDTTGAAVLNGTGVINVRTRVTAAQVDAGLTLLPLVTGSKYRLVDATLIAIGGAAAGATTVTLLATQAAGSVKLLDVAVAALTQSAVVKPDSANVTVLANGASFVPNDVSTAITVGKTGSGLTTATHIDVLLSYTLEA